ncbi:alpha/beta hydrolase [Gaetbulibacter aestuarii]|uniref:Alpha/beta hydrolase n=1 Tax=Gaetbulibacter aestuarii TaxID=1502358 RepID=A0ABW7MXR1_9FLAO
MIRTFYFILLLLCSAHSSFGQTIVKLWPEGVPNQKISDEAEYSENTGILKIFNVQDPTLEVFLPSKTLRIGKAVIICPGGGYRYLSYNFEGTDFAKLLNSKGIAAFVLKYRLPDSKSLITPNIAPLQDAQRAMRYVRSQAETYGISPNQIGIMGFSAGGHLAATLGTHYNDTVYEPTTPMDSLSARPDFLVLAYPVITMKEPYAHKGSRRNLLVQEATSDLIEFYSNELQVDENTPPTFLVHASDDKGVPVMNSILFYEALKQHDVPAEIHIYPKGGHGFGLAIKKGHLSTWTDRLFEWMESLELE